MSQAPLTRRQLRELEERRARTTGRKDARKSVKVRVKIVAAPRKKSHAGSKLMSLGALLFAGALLVGMSVPANAFMPEGGTTAASGSTSIARIQSLSVPSDAIAGDSARDKFTVISYAQVLAEKYGNVSYDYTVTTGAVRWPFPYAVPISDGYGWRVAPCSGCSSQHQGVDFTPGSGTPVYAIADGVVQLHSDTSGGFGNHVIISHVINGVAVDSIYAHLQAGSSPVNTGDTIKVGDFLGLVGETGSAVGAHLHFEIHIDGVAVDPFAWLQANAVN